MNYRIHNDSRLLLGDAYFASILFIVSDDIKAIYNIKPINIGRLFLHKKNRIFVT
jgi:hypothetical protein